MQDKVEFYKKLKTQLDDLTKVWPSKYMYKFIVPADGTGVKEVEDKFDGLGAVVNTRNSRGGKYTSITINVIMSSSDSIIKKYRDCEDVKGIISL
jgi:putative lipoic acid-binding regulatory protein